MRGAGWWLVKVSIQIVRMCEVEARDDFGVRYVWRDIVVRLEGR